MDQGVLKYNMGEKPIRVCHVVNAVGPTSIPADIAIELQQSTDVQVGMLSWFKIDEFENMEDIDLYSANPPQTTMGINYSTASRVQDIFAEYDIIHTHHPHSGSFSKILASKVDKKIITTEHNAHKGYSSKGLILNGLTNTIPDAITCVSKSVYNSFRWWEKKIVSDENIYIIYNGVKDISSSMDMEWSVYEHCNIKSDEYLIGISARHTEQKAHDVLIQAVSELRNQGYKINLMITGTGPLRDSLKRLATDEGIEDNVHFLGLIDQDKLYRLVSELDIYSMPSRWEGYCVGVAEAMALGTPCILSDIDVFKEVYGDCALYHSVDDFRELASKIEQLLSDENLQKELSTCGSDVINSQYKIEDVVTQYESLYRSIV